MSSGQALMTGLSLTVTLNEQLDVPHEFAAEHVTTVVPKANVEPEAGEQTTAAAGEPEAVGVIQEATLLSH
jgi:hypothetical protein